MSSSISEYSSLALKLRGILGANRVIYTDKYLLINGDCREILPHLAPVDLLLTDPPYGIREDKGKDGGGTDASGLYARKPKKYEGGWDLERPSPEIFKLLLRSAKTSVIWGGNYFADILPQSGKWLFWNKRNSMPTYSDGEMAWTNLNGDSVKMFTQCASGPASIDFDGRHHPTQKPVGLMAWCLGFAPDAGTVLDAYGGVFSTGVATIRYRKHFIGIEQDERYFAIGAQRLEAATGSFSPRQFETTGLFAQETP